MLNTLRNLLFPVLHALGPVLIAFAGLMLVPVIYSWTEQDGALEDFLLSAGITFGFGLLLTLLFLPFRRELSARHGFLLVTLSWALIGAFAAIPLFLNLQGETLPRVYFESMSCLTTTGGTVLSGLDELPRSINGWRCFLSWLGGMGLIVMSVAILPLLGVGGAQIMKAETSGPLKETRLTPRIAETARSLYAIYFGISFACACAYHLAGMSWRDAIFHMMTTVSLSGISSHDDSFAYFHSAPIEVVATLFMLICGISFSLHFIAWRRRDLKLYFNDPEVIAWISLVLSLIGLSTFVLYTQNLCPSLLDALRNAAFSVMSVASTTGYTGSDWSAWPLGLPLVLMLASAVATCAGSTGGGLKMLRALVLLRQAQREFLHLLYPNAVTPLTIGTTPISNSIAFAVLSYTLIWIITVIVGAVVLLLTGLPPLEACSAAFSSVVNLGPALGSVGPTGNFGNLEGTQLGILTFLMLAGRLELFTVFVLFTRTFWRL